MNYDIKEENESNPWLIENAEEFLKYCCANCDFNSKDLQDFSNHVSANHFTSNLFFQGKVNKQVKRTISKPFNFKKLEKKIPQLEFDTPFETEFAFPTSVLEDNFGGKSHSL